MNEASNLRNTPVQSRGAARLATIREHALTHLREVGVRSFHPQVVADMGGMSIGTVYRYFPTAEALIEDVAPGACRAWVVLDEVRGMVEELPETHLADALERILFVGTPPDDALPSGTINYGGMAEPPHGFHDLDFADDNRTLRPRRIGA